MYEIHSVCFCKTHRWQHTAGQGCEAGKLAAMLNIDISLAAWLVSKYGGTAEGGADAAENSNEEHTLIMLERHGYERGKIDILELMNHWGIIDDAEYLKRAFPNPRFTYEELEATNWSPSELGF